jgi:ABC-type uncharacterized transport system permease subunit
MDTTLTVLNALLPALYGALVAVYAVLLARDLPWARRAGPRLLVATVTLHLLTVVAGGVWAGRHPIANKFELFSFVALAMAASYLWVEWRRRNPYTGVFPLSLALLLQACAALGRVERPDFPEILRNRLFAWHSLSAAVAMAALSVGAVYGALFLAMYRRLKRDDLGTFTERMPSLDTLAGMSLHAVEVGFVALTLTVGLGDLWIQGSPGLSMADPKIWATFAAWAVYGGALVGRFAAHWGGWRIVALNLAGYAILLGSLLMVGRVFDSFHRFTGKP